MIDFKNILNSNDKLIAVHSLLEQMRLEHNKQGEIARNNPKLLENGKWKEYQRKFAEKQRPLILETVKLRKTLRREQVDDEIWSFLDPEEQREILDGINALKIEGKKIITTATSIELKELKEIKVDGDRGLHISKLE